MKRSIIAGCGILFMIPWVMLSAERPEWQQMQEASTPEDLKAERFITYRESDSDLVSLKSGDTNLTLNPKNLELTLQKGDAIFRFQAPAAATIQLPDGQELQLNLQDATSCIVTSEQWGGIRGIACSLSKFSLPNQAACDLKVVLFAGLDYATGDVIFELRPEEQNTKLRQAVWPGALDGSEVDSTTIPHTQGLLIPRNWAKVIDAPYADMGKIGMVYGRSLYMPWWGVTKGNVSAMMILETPDDAGIQLYHSPEQGTTITPIWLHSLGKMDKTRRARIKVVDGNYVAMAKAYRKFAQENGTYRSLKSKIAETPLLQKLIGSPILHVTARQFNARSGQDDLFTSYADLAAKMERLHRDFGIEHAYLHIDGIGYRGYDNFEPDQLPVGEKAGGKEGLRQLLDTVHSYDWVVIYHQQYRDMYLDAPSYRDDLLVRRENGTHHVENTWAGGPNALLCASRALDYLKRNNNYLEAIGVKPDGCYLDVFAVVPGDECYHPEHKMSRTDCYRLRRQCFDYVKNHIGIVSSEEPVDWAVSTLHLTHHTVWAVQNGANFAVPLPLFNLVYHDAILTPFETTRGRGSYYYAQSEIPFLHALICAGMPYLSENAEAEDVAAVKILTELHQRTALCEMTDHEILTPDGTQQRATYADGTVITVDQESGDWSIVYPDKTIRGNAIHWSVEEQ